MCVSLGYIGDGMSIPWEESTSLECAHCVQVCSIMMCAFIRLLLLLGFHGTRKRARRRPKHAAGAAMHCNPLRSSLLLDHFPHGYYALSIHSFTSSFVWVPIQQVKKCIEKCIEIDIPCLTYPFLEFSQSCRKSIEFSKELDGFLKRLLNWHPEGGVKTAKGGHSVSL